MMDQKIFDVKESSNQVMTGFIEAWRLWPKHDIVILSISTGLLENCAISI